MTRRALPSLALCAAALAASPPAASAASRAPKDARPVLAVLSVHGGTGFGRDDVDTVESLLLHALEATGRFHVIGQSDIVTLLDLEAKKQAAGCSGDDTSCMTAIAGALGANYVAAGSLGMLGRTMVLSFKVIEVSSASALVHAQETVHAKEDLVEATNAVATETVTAIFGGGGAPAREPPRKSPATTPRNVDLSAPATHTKPAPAAGAAVTTTRRNEPSAGRALGIVATVLGAVGLAVGTGLAIVAQQQTASTRSTPTSTSVESRVTGVNNLVTGSIVGWAAGGAIAVTGVGLLVAF